MFYVLLYNNKMECIFFHETFVIIDTKLSQYEIYYMKNKEYVIIYKKKIELRI